MARCCRCRFSHFCWPLPLVLHTKSVTGNIAEVQPQDRNSQLSGELSPFLLWHLLKNQLQTHVSRASLLLLGFVPQRCRTHAPTQFEYWRRPSRLQKHLYPTCKHSIKSSRRMASLGSCSEDFRQKSFPMDSKACFSTYSGNQFLILWRSKRKRNDFRGTDNLASFNYRFYFPWRKDLKERGKHNWYGKDRNTWQLESNYGCSNWNSRYMPI